MTAKREYNARAPQLRVVVTAEIIAKSQQRDSSHCMLAEAVKEAARAAGFHPKFPGVDLQTIRFTDPDNGYRYTYLTPRRCQVALIDFDQGRETEPFVFQLRGGQVTKSGVRGKNRPGGYVRPPTPAQVEASRENLAGANAVNPAAGINLPADAPQEDAAQQPEVQAVPQVGGNARNNDLSKTRLVPPPPGKRYIPERHGGKTPPTTPFARRRQFGLRAFER